MKLYSGSLRKAKDPHATALARRLDACIDDAAYWSKRMPREVTSLVHRARRFSIASGALSFSTGLLAWPLVAESSSLTAQTVISGLSGLAALAITAPYAGGLSDRGDESIDLCRAYGVAHRDLLDAKARLAGGSRRASAQAAEAIDRFECIQERREALRLPGLPVREEPPSVREEPPSVRDELPSVGGEREQLGLGLVPSNEAEPPSLPSRHAYAALDEEMRATLAHMLTSRSEPQGLALGPEAWTSVAALHPVPSPAKTPEAESADYAPAEPRPALPGQTSRGHGQGRPWGEFLGSMVETGHRATRAGKDSTNAVAAYLGLAERTACQKNL
ncbi:hypothetical protein [Streptomyces sp. McG3]|uniref:hypothetical protein n=1 Tax=Streptomyces sp. McG3 TaxID=2725483 RepID=UPI001BEB9FB8|nr:hypothetical protein [Streptomyces sp. McG3]MBT2898905.1 hypothetical protein [Streptomyces sp. McG3]